uniref:Uncharacterized protein n=1 Tax=Ornithorhynchus anatinus TaxID=9258 RepID=F6TV87_ORNAN
MASGGRPSPLDGLELSSDEAERLSRAFGEPEFRRLLGEYASELSDPDNRRLYEPSCPPARAHQDEARCTLVILVPHIQPHSLRGALTPRQYELRFVTRDFTPYSGVLRFPPGNELSSKEPAISCSPSNAVIELAKSPESRGPWRKWYFGPNAQALQERLFISEENVDGFLDDSLGSQVFEQSGPETQPLIEVLEVTDDKSRIHLKVRICQLCERVIYGTFKA